MTFAKDDLIAALRGRYDYYSAESMFGVARERATLADKPAYDAAEVRALRGVLAGINDRLGGVLAHLDAMLERAGTTPAPATPPTAPAAPAAPAAAPAAPAPAATEEAPRSGKKSKGGDDKGGDHKADKPDAKPEAKPDGGGDTTIVLTGVKLVEGDHVLVCGGLPALGDWDPAKAAPMVADGDHWRLAVAVPAGADVAYKFLRRGADGTVTWEAGENRPLVAAPRVDATWR